MKRTVGLARNLTSSVSAPQQPLSSFTASPEPIQKTQTPVAPYDHKVKEVASHPARTKKISFLTEPKLEERFRKARLKAGFDKLEDAYNEAIKTFCDLVDAGKIDRF
jgi:hypothetical protein